MAMDQSDIKKYKDLFLKSSGEYITDMEKQVAILSNDPQNGEAVEQLFIDSHSLSSETSMMKFTTMELFCKTLNLAVRASREKSMPLSAQTITAIIEGVTQLRKSYNEIESTDNELNLSPFIKNLEEAAGVKVQEE